MICGCAETGIDGISFRDLEMRCTGTAKIHSSDPAGPYGLWSKTVPDCAFYIAHARNVRFERTAIDWGDFAPQWQYGFMVYRSRGIELKECETGKPAFGCPE